METVLLACTFAAFALSVAGAPTYPESEEQQLRQYPEEYQYLREARSQLPLQYITPCAAAAAAAAAGSAHMPAYAAPYHLNLPYGVSHYGAPHYRSVDEQMAEPEMLAFSDMDQIQHGHPMMMDHVPMSRTAFGRQVSPMSQGLALNGPMLTPAASPAYGIFPNAHVGGCNVPLLFSCSPSISSGRIMDQPMSPAVPAIPANTYRLVEQLHHDSHEHSEEVPDRNLQAMHQTAHGAPTHR